MTNKQVVDAWLKMPPADRVMAMVEDGSIAVALAQEIERLRDKAGES
jgi:hypothetical protein